MTANQIVSLNGRFVPIEEASVPVLDRGFIFGDGIYEVVPSYGGRLFRWPQHLARLKRSLAKVRIDNPHDDASWLGLVQDLIARHPWADQFIYLQVTRGVARRDHAFPKGIAPTVFGMASELVPVPAQQREQGVAAITLPDERWLHCDIKSVSLLGNVLARQAAVDAQAIECMMFRDGFLTEASASNVLVVSDGTIIVPPKDNLILPGVTYDATMEFARDIGVPLSVRPVPKAEALAADEMWLSSSTKEVLAITTVDGQPFSGGRPGPVFRRMWAEFQARKPHAMPPA